MLWRSGAQISVKAELPILYSNDSINQEIDRAKERLATLYARRANRPGAPGWRYCPSGEHYEPVGVVGCFTCACGARNDG